MPNEVDFGNSDHFGSLRAEYDAYRSKADEFAGWLFHELQRRTDTAGLDLAFPIQVRVKSWESLHAKAIRRHLYNPRLSAFDDLVAARVIVQFRHEVSLVSQAVASMHPPPPWSKPHYKAVEVFGYDSLHTLVDAPLTTPYARMRAELQIRTTAQHIWASASHSIQYKNEDLTSKAVRRAIHRLAAVLELVDDELERVLAAKRRVGDRFGVKEMEPLSSRRMEQLLRELLPGNEWVDHTASDDSCSDLLRAAVDVGISSVELLQVVLTKHRDAFVRHHESLRIHDFFPPAPYARTALVRFAMTAEFDNEWEKAYRDATAYRNFLPDLH